MYVKEKTKTFKELNGNKRNYATHHHKNKKVQNPFVQDKKKLLLQNDKSFKSLNKPDKLDPL